MSKPISHELKDNLILSEESGIVRTKSFTKKLIITRTTTANLNEQMNSKPLSSDMHSNRYTIHTYIYI